MKTFSPTPEHIDHQWFVVDADNQVLGRLAAQIAHRLRGKHKPEFAPHMDNGDVIVVVNCEKIKVTGAKLERKSITIIPAMWAVCVKLRSTSSLLRSLPTC